MDTIEIANIIKNQIGVRQLMTLGANEIRAFEDADGNAGLRFSARILGFNKNGKRGAQVRKMTVQITLNPMDTYDIEVRYADRIHYEVEGIYADQLPKIMLALDYDGPEILNPRVL